MQKNIYDFAVKKIDGKNTTLKEYEGKALLLVNVASKCGLTPQYAALEKLYKKYKAQGFFVLGFPANEFGAQEPGTNAEIQEFCTLEFGVTFPLFQKIVVKGAGQHPLYQFLTHEKPLAEIPKNSDFEKKLEGYGQKREKKSDILWNFEKFLVGRDGAVVMRFSPDTTPDDPILLKAIVAAL